MNEAVKVPGKPPYPQGDIEILNDKDVSSFIEACSLDLPGHILLYLCLGGREWLKSSESGLFRVQ